MDFTQAFKDGMLLAKDTRLARVYFSFLSAAIFFTLAPLAFLPTVALNSLAASQNAGELAEKIFSGTGMLFQYYLLLCIALILESIYLNALFASHAKQLLEGKKPDLEKSGKLAQKSLANLFFAAIAAFVLQNAALLTLGLATLIPLAGIFFKIIEPIAGIAIALAFFFTEYSVVIGGKNAFGAITQSLELFEKRGLQAFLTLGLSTIISIAVIAVGAIPLFAALFLSGASLLFSQSGTVFLLSFALFGIAGTILLIAISFAQVAAAGIKASAYRQLSAEIESKSNP